MRSKLAVLFLAIVPMVLAIHAIAQCPASVPVEGAPPPAPLPIFPPDNWWNLDISGAPVDTGSPRDIAFVNNGRTREPPPGIGGKAAPGSGGGYRRPAWV